MSDPLAPSSDPDIPTPTLDDLVPLVYGPHREDVRHGTADAQLIQTLLRDARKQWDEGHKRDAARRAEEAKPPQVEEIGLTLVGSELEGIPRDVDSEFRGTFGDTQPSQASSDTATGEGGDITPPDGAASQGSSSEMDVPTPNKWLPQESNERPNNPAVENLSLSLPQQKVENIPLNISDSKEGGMPAEKLQNAAKCLESEQAISGSLWRDSIKPPLVWLAAFIRKWAALAGFALLGASWSMIQIDEYLLAGVLLAIAGFAFFVQIFDWNGIPNHRGATRIIKTICLVAIAFCFIYFGMVILKKKGSKPLSNLFVGEGEILRTPQPKPQPSLFPNPTPTATDTATASPSPIPTLSPSLSPSPSPSPSASPSPSPFFTQLMELKGGLTNVKLSELFADYGYRGSAEVFNLQIINLSKTRSIYFHARFRPINGIIEPGQTQQWQRININELYLATREPVTFIVNFVYEREGD